MHELHLSSVIVGGWVNLCHRSHLLRYNLPNNMVCVGDLPKCVDRQLLNEVRSRDMVSVSVALVVLREGISAVHILHLLPQKFNSVVIPLEDVVLIYQCYAQLNVGWRIQIQ